MTTRIRALAFYTATFAVMSGAGYTLGLHLFG